MPNHYPNIPEYLRIAEILRNDIAANYRCGEKYPSQNELIRRHKVSYCTISKALAELVEEGLIRRERGSGTFVNTPHRNDSSTAPQHLNTIGILLNNHQDSEYSPFMADVGKYLIKSANQAGYIVQFLPSKLLAPALWNRFWKQPTVAGLICFNPNSMEPQEFFQLTSQLPTVFSEKLDQDHHLDHYSYCDFDIEAGIRLGVEHLLANGRRRIALILGSTRRHPLYARRLASYKQTLERANIPCDPELIFEADFFTSAAGAEAMSKLLEAKPDAVLISSASFGIGAINTILHRNLRIPEDISVIGHDDQLFFSPAFQCLSCIEVPIQDFADALVRQMISLIHNTREENRIFQPYLQQGNSVIVH